MRDNNNETFVPARSRRSGFWFLSVIICMAGAVRAQTNAFTYQGRLLDNGSPANGGYDLQFSLYSVDSGGAALGTLAQAPVAVSNGLFAVTLDFGAGAFDGGSRWLQIGVRTNGSASGYTVLNPRQLITPAPYAITASRFSGPLTASLTNNSGPNADAIFSESGIDRSATNSQTFFLTNSGGGGLSLLVKSEVRAGAGSATTPSFSFIANTNTGMFNPAASTLAFSAGGAERMRIAPGNVAITGSLTLSNTAASVSINGTISPSSSFMVLSASSVVTLNATTAIADAAAPGTLLILQGSSDINTITIPDNANTRLGGARILGDRDTLTLIYNGTEWIEIAYANN